MNAAMLLTMQASTLINEAFGYLTGVLIALFVFGYLIYSLIKPEKF